MATETIPATDVALKYAGQQVGAIGMIAIGLQQPDTPGNAVSALRAELENGTLTNLQSSGIGSKADHSA